jgi:hypothetical protein
MHEQWDRTTLLHILGVGGITALVIWVGYGVMWLALNLLKWWEGGE